ncbi:hypothetical protein Tco_0536255 [Tanacetum coccineum]
MNQGRQVIPVNFFINNDLEYLKGGNSTKKYTTSKTKTKGLEYGRYGVSKVLDTAYRGFLGAQIRRIFLDGYGILDVRTVIFKYLRLSSKRRAF